MWGEGRRVGVEGRGDLGEASGWMTQSKCSLSISSPDTFCSDDIRKQ